MRTIYWARAMDVWGEHEAVGSRRRLVRAGAAAVPRRADPGTPRPRLRPPDARRPRPARAGGEPRRAGRLAARDPHHAGADTRAACPRHGRRSGPGLLALALVAVVFGVHSDARLDLVRAGGGDHGAVLRRLGRRARPAAACRGGRRRGRRGAAMSFRPGAVCSARVARRRSPSWRWRWSRRSRSRSPGARTTRATSRLRCSTRATSPRPAPPPTARPTSTRCPPSRTSSAPRSRTPRATAARPCARCRTRCAWSPPARRHGGASGEYYAINLDDAGPRGAGAAGRAVPRPGLTAEPQRVPRRAARPRRRGRRARGRRPAAPAPAARPARRRDRARATPTPRHAP